MARAYPSPLGDDHEPNPEEWRALRGQLMDLLDQVEHQYARATPGESGDPDLRGLADRMKALREQVRGADQGERHQQALRSVKRAIDRFSERDEVYGTGPREALASAISEIRGRPAPESAARAQPAPESRADLMAKFEELARAIGGIGSRMERIESGIATHRADPAGLQQIADQVAQVSQVVELLARAAGETANFTRLEDQIASLAKLVTEGHGVDLSALARRLDEVSGTVERLADLQIQHVSREKDLPAQQAAARQAIEQQLGDVYERIELIERNFLIAPGDVHRLMDEMGQLADALRNPTPPQHLVGLIDALNSRIDEIEAGGREVKGLKGDIESMRVQLVQRLDLTPLSQRLEDVSATVERMADQQARDREDPAQQASLRSGIQAIEKSIRAIYDRIDSLEQTYALRPDDLDKLTSGLARITAAIQNPEPPHELIALVDALNARIGEIDGRGNAMVSLRTDIAGLRDAVVSAVEPRLAAVEIQLSALNERVAEQPAANSGIGQIEAQVRQIVARMDQTGEQITGLARLYAESSDRTPPDYEQLARMVAEQTSAAIGTRGSEAPGGLSGGDLDVLERRMARLFEAAAHEKPPEDFSAVYEGIRRVDDRLQRLEGMLERLNRETAAEPVLAAASVEGPPEDTVQVFSASRPSRPRSDAMPVSPAVDRPLADRPFPDLSPVKAGPESRVGRKMHPGLDETPLDPDGMSPVTAEMLAGAPSWPDPQRVRAEIAPSPDFDPARVTPPPRPSSTLDFAERPIFETETAPDTEAPAGSAEPAIPSSRNSFIAAARRAAQRPAQKDAGANSLIGRALARFQGGTAERPGGVKPAGADRPRQEAQADRQEPGPAGRIEPVVGAAEAGPADAGRPAGGRSRSKAPVPGSEPEESLLVRHRQPILLAASIVALSFLTLNLINQRQAEDGATDPAAVEAADPAADLGAVTPEPGPAITQPQIEVASAALPSRVIPVVDTLQTGAVDPAAARSFSPIVPTPPMPAAFKAIEDNASASVPPPPTDGPVKADLPPEGLGPLPLRQAAADGDPRAQFEVAAIYTEGRAVPQDLALAATWYERAAAQGFAPAQYRLANLYENGKGVEKNLDQAKAWYRRAAEAGNRMAMHNLAALYASGDFGKQDFVAAAGWFEKAAGEGLTDSQFNLGMLYARGLGVPQNMELSYRWFALAARSGDQDAAKARDDIARSLDAETVKRLGNEVGAWTPAAIDLAANYAPIGTWDEDFDPGQVISNPEVVVGVQTLLGRLGYDIGAPDGVAGPRTAEAIRAFERATGMTEVGLINPRLLAVLGSQPG